MKKYSTVLSALLLSASVFMSGCSESDGNNATNDTNTTEEETASLLFFYNDNTKDFYTYETDHKEAIDQNKNTTNNIDLSDKESVRIIHWPHETTEGNETSIDNKFILVKQAYEYSLENNLTHENLIHIGHFHDEELAVHEANEFDPNSDVFLEYNTTIQQKKLATLNALNTYLAEQYEIKEEIKEALLNESKTLCNFFVPHHEEHEEEKIPHYALSTDGQFYIFKDGETSLEKIQEPVILDGATSCTTEASAITAKSEYGVYVYLGSTQKLYVVDQATGADYHQHSQQHISELLPSGITATQMIGFGGNEEDDHDNHDH